MSEDTAAETTDEVVETPPEGDPSADTEDLGALKRAYERVKDERQQAKEELRRLREDDEAQKEFLRELGYEVADDEDTSEEEDTALDDDDPVAPLRSELDELKQWKNQQQQQQENAAIRKDIDAINAAADTGWELDDHDRLVIEAWARRDTKGQQFTRDDLATAHQAYIDRLEAIAAKGVERAKKPKPKPSSRVAAGQAATGIDPSALDDDGERHRYMAERLQALNQQ